MVISHMGKKMNVLYVHTHDTGRYLTPYGYPAGTSRLQEFAKDALVFRKAFCVSPTCTPSRGAMLTGRYPHCNGLAGLTHRGFSLNNPGQHLAAYLHTQGFATALSGVQHEEEFWLPRERGKRGANRLGYETVLTDFSVTPGNPEEYLEWDKKNAKAAADFLKTYEKQRPFFLSYGLFSTHRPYPQIREEERETFDCRYSPISYGMEDNKENREDMAGFLKSLHCCDRNFGIVLDALKAYGYYDSTIILVTTDHGLANPFSKCCLNDAGTGVALMMRVPGYGGSYGCVSDALVSQLDVFPTICRLLNLPEPFWLQGESFAECFEDPKREAREELIQEINFHTSYEPARSIRSRRYRYVRYLDEEWPWYNISNCDESPAKAKLLENGWQEKRKSREYLYDLLFDPEEKINLADDPEYQHVLEEFRRKLSRHMEETEDCILERECYRKQYEVNKKQCTYPSICTEDERE